MLTLAFRLSSSDSREVRVVVFNLLGQPVAQVLRPTRLKPGRYTLVWHGTDWRGKPVAEGRYVVEYRTGDDHVLAVVPWPQKR